MYKALIEQQGFRLISQIDNTLHTEIWKANQRELDRVVCLQILKPEASQNALELEHFLVIARTFAKVKSESIAAVFDIVSTSDIHYVVMEYVDGPTAGSLVKNGHRLSQAHILQIAASLAGCFEQLWQKDQIIHRNLKGETVQIDPRGVAKLTDFSLAITVTQDLNALDAGHIVGTPSFIAPEYAQGSKQLTTQADMYSFGALLYQLATGHAPFASLSPVDALSAQIRSQILPPHMLNHDISVAFSWFVHRLMMKNPVNRYPDWHAVIMDIHRLMQGDLPTGIETEERFLSTIDSKPLLDAMREVDEDEEEDEDDDAEAEEKQDKVAYGVKTKTNNRMLSQVEMAYRRDVLRSNIRLGALMILLMLAWFAGLFWYRGICVPETKRATTMNNGTAEVSTEGHQRGPHPERPDRRPPILKERSLVALEPMPAMLKKTLVRNAKDGNLSAMRAAIVDEEKPFVDKDNVRSILIKAPTFYKLLERSMDSKKDQTISFMWRGRSRIVVPREVTEESVTLEVNGRRQDIRFSELTPDEMIRLINKPQTEPEALSYSLLLMSTAQKSEVPDYASKCLPLQEVLIEALKDE